MRIENSGMPRYSFRTLLGILTVFAVAAAYGAITGARGFFFVVCLASSVAVLRAGWLWALTPEMEWPSGMTGLAFFAIVPFFLLGGSVAIVLIFLRALCHQPVWFPWLLCR